MTLTPTQRKQLRARAHALDPVVMIGDKGLSETALQEIERSLLSHELIKIRVSMDDRKAREDIGAVICAQLNAVSIQSIGKVLVVYRANPDKKPQAQATPTRSRRKTAARQPKKAYQDR